MNQVACPACQFDNAPDQAYCQQCNAPLAPPPVDSSATAEEQLRQLKARLAAINEDIQELTTPTRTTSFNGCGIMLLDYRPVEDGNYEASRWVTLFGFPLVPLSVWKIHPRRYSQDARGERQSFNLLEKRRLTIDRFLRPYLFLAIGALPFVLAYYFVNLNPLIYFIGRAIGTGFAVAFIILLIILVLVWIGYIMTRFHNAGTAYKQKTP
ncbi:MAG TPA: zinc ribbon domain-containing protein [Pyrinomonadaceae bacterium]